MSPRHSLQWSRRYSRRIIYNACDLLAKGNNASMEPPLFTADNQFWQSEQEYHLPASMEPPLFTADNFPPTRTLSARSRSFNGAAVIHGG